MLRACLQAAVVFLASCQAWLAEAAERRVALVIGNGAYSQVESLRNPANDASDMAGALEGLGFEVMQGLDAGREEMTRLIADYTSAARNADVSLFYYAGHGFQIDARNYLVPADADFANPDAILSQTIELGEITRGLEGAAGSNLVFLDACRDNPLQDLAGDGAGGFQSGLARIGNAAGFLFAFATQPDNVAVDGIGRNSPFTQAVLSHMNTPGQEIASMMISVRKDVLAATGGMQVPWENSSLTKRFQFVPGKAAATPETMLWQVAASARDPDLMRIYLDRYPEGAHFSDARAYLKTTRVSALPQDGGTITRTVPSGSADAVSAKALWELARRMRMRPLVEIYLSQNPDGLFAGEARELLLSLPKEDDLFAPPELLCDRLATHPRDATANTAGVPMAELSRNAGVAIEACRQAVSARPDIPHYAALLARARIAAGQRVEAILLYREAAERGDLRALVSMGLITETGDGVARDPAAAVAFYQRAAEGGSPDGAINLAVALINGTGIDRDAGRAVALLVQAADAGSAIATYNLGVLAQDGVEGTGAAAIAHFRKAAGLGEARGYVAAAILLDEGRGTGSDPDAAADMLLRGAAADFGEAINQMTVRSENWAPGTIRAVQSKLKDAGYYDSSIDGVSGPVLEAALRSWRDGGFVRELSDG